MSRGVTVRSSVWGRVQVRLAAFVALSGVIALVAFRAPEAPVATAAMHNNADEVRELLKEGADVNAALGDGMTALHWAAYNGNDALGSVLLYAGANPEAATRIGHYTPMMIAAQQGHGDMVAKLLEAGADARATTTTGVTTLHMAAASGSAIAERSLIAHGADVNAKESAWQQTPLMWAANEGRIEAAQVLIDAGADLEAASAAVDVKTLEEEDAVEGRERRERMAAIRAERLAEAAGSEQAVDTEAAAAAAAAAPADDLRGTAEPAEPEAEAAQAESAEEAAAEPAAETAEAPQGEPDRDVAAGAPQGGPSAGNEPAPLSFGDLVGGHGGLNALHYAVREGHAEVALALIDAGADINARSGGDQSTPLVVATINGHFDLGLELLARGADVNMASGAGVTPLFGAINVHWAPKALYPQPKAHEQQQVSYLEYMERLLEAGADPNARVDRHVWFMSYNFDLLGVDTGGATAFWRAAYATDVAAMKLLVAHGADPEIPTRKPVERRRRGGGDQEDQSGLEPIPVGGPGVYAIHAASGVGYGKDFAANSHRYAPDGWMPAIRYLVEELGADVNARDYEGFTPLHHAAARGDVEMIEYLVSMGADPTLIARRGQTTADMANGPVQRVQPFPEAVSLLESLGSKNNNNCLSC